MTASVACFINAGMDDPVAFVKARRIALAAKAEQLDARISAMQQERAVLAAKLRDLDIAQRVLIEIADEVAEELGHSQDLVFTRVEDVVDSRPKGRPKGTPRPVGIPTVNGMVAIVLRDALARTGKGLTSLEIVREVGLRWWPGVVSNAIMPSVYRAIKRGQAFEKVGEIFTLKTDAEFENFQWDSPTEPDEDDPFEDIEVDPQ